MNDAKPHECVDYDALPTAMAMIDAAIDVLDSSGSQEIDDMRDRLNEERNLINAWRLDYLGGKFNVSDLL